MSNIRTLSATEVCERLGIQPATLYAYVSRGLIRSESLPDSRAKAYRAEDVEQLERKRKIRSAPESGALHSLNWGLPVLASSVSTIDDGKLYYRGQPIETLLDLSLEDLVRLLWDRPALEFPSPQPAPLPIDDTRLAGLGGYERLQLSLLWQGTQDLGAFDLSPTGIEASCLRILQTLFALMAGPGVRPKGKAVTGLLGGFASLDAPRRNLLRTLLLLCADHELNNSTFTARCVASAQSTPYAAVTAALASLEGRRHGGSTRRSEALLHAAEAAASVPAGLRAWLQQGESLPGCGHPLYPDGDPRFKILVQLFESDFATHPAWQLGREVVASLATLDQNPPNIDLGLAIANRIIAWPGSEGLVWFALGRSIGWLAHIQEQYAQPLLIRPRAVHIS